MSDAKALSELPAELDELLSREEPEWNALAEQHANLRSVKASLPIDRSDYNRARNA